VLLSVTGEVPKSEDAFFYEGYMTVTFPGPPLLTIAEAKAPRDIIEEGSIGGIKISTPEATILTAGLGTPKKGEDTTWEAIGEAVQEWDFPDSGLTVNMISEKIGTAKTVFTITLKAPSKLKTDMGISIGSTKDDVVKAYADFNTEKDELKILSDERNAHLVGSIYGGMIFTFQDDKVTEIFLGAAAE
jgi:hypothetical protein